MTNPNERRQLSRISISSHLALLLILSLSVFIQFSVVARTVVDAPFRADAREYFFSAYNLSHYGVYSHRVTWPASEHPQPPPDAQVSPGYPLFLALIGNPEPTEACLRRITYTKAALAVLSVWLLFLIASRGSGQLPMVACVSLRPAWRAFDGGKGGLDVRALSTRLRQSARLYSATRVPREPLINFRSW